MPQAPTIYELVEKQLKWNGQFRAVNYARETAEQFRSELYRHGRFLTYQNELSNRAAYLGEHIACVDKLPIQALYIATDSRPFEIWYLEHLFTDELIFGPNVPQYTRGLMSVIFKLERLDSSFAATAESRSALDQLVANSNKDPEKIITQFFRWLEGR